ncbi:DUF4031 domain-containing protein [Methylobacterium sp. J-059]|uniref:DUF4031 domain-containing protein n=1 Tax=Methylobacterium sp. J-059 TaxID=2836643 RepID=UPI001FBBB057|nr:DUF4031 domain-containing protein [Methylobacterium sp. J-059]MCJ2039835.1 DUF4031 domain-containing protein [Methylobacterium sp. J-059]
MSVYVDQPIFPFGRIMMCHLWADSLDELLAMVDRIGVQRKWIQGHPTLSFGKHRNASWVHFDIAKGKRTRAIEAGAIETDTYGAVYWQAQREGNTAKIAMIDGVRARRREVEVAAAEEARLDG